MTDVPYVFVSYSQESDEHIHRVLTLVQWLRNHGVEAYVDKFEQSPPESWQLWCHEQIEKATYVLVVCTETYEQRVLRRAPAGIGRGATWEGAIITNELYDDTAGQAKYIPIVFSPEDAEFIPFFLKGATYYDVDDQESLEDLYRRLTGQPEFVPAPIGEVITYPEAQLETPLPVVPKPPLYGSTSSRQPAGAGQPRLADVIPGEWVVQIQNPFGSQMMRIVMEGADGRGTFTASVIVGPPGWQASGTWEVLPGEQLALNGMQQMQFPVAQTMIYQTFARFFSVTRDELQGTSAIQESVVWRRA